MAGAVVVLVGFVVGALAGGLGSLTHQSTVAAARWPVGLAVALALTTCCGLLVRGLGVGVLGRAGLLMGWLVVVWAAAGRRPEGDLVVPANARGYVWLLVGFGLLLVVLFAPARAARPARR